MSVFRLQQFSIEQNLSGMKVCSDSLLFGAIIPVASAKRILDIGTGTGLLALMQAQKVYSERGNAVVKITAIELTQEAAKEAGKNFNTSPWPDSFELIQQDVQSFSAQYKAHSDLQNKARKDVAVNGFDLIICNPPFFDDHTRTQTRLPETRKDLQSDQRKDELRGIARHTDTLSYLELCAAISNLLSTEGRGYVLLPTSSISVFADTANSVGLVLNGITDIAESCDYPAKVAMLELKHRSYIQSHNPDLSPSPNHYPNPISSEIDSISKTTLYKFGRDKQHSAEVKHYLSPFLLRYAD
jgi:tRNA1Val (adenine37-N6)-methyltransferase